LNKQEKAKTDTQKYIEAAVNAAVEACMKGIDEKIAAAVNMGVTIGAAAGAEVGAKAAVQSIEKERKKFKQQQYDKRFQNTKLLLKHYRSLNEYFKNAVFDTEGAEEEDEDFSEIMQTMSGYANDEDLYVESIKKSSIRTRIIITHVNKMLDIYKIMCINGKRENDKRHWRIIEAMYLNEKPVSAAEIARQESVDKRTIYKDIDSVTGDLTILFFGIDGIEKLQ
jgi:hypothetical protein